jgi:DNA polymerase-3 subunit delta
MVQIKTADADRFLAKPDPDLPVVLIYGNDEGRVSERAETLARAVAGDDPLARVRLDIDAVADDPGLLADEANAVPMFGGTRAISLRVAGNRHIEGAIEALLANPPRDAVVVIAAGDLRKSSPLLKVCEASDHAAVIRCFADEARDLDRVIDEELAAAGLAIAPDARAALRTLLGGDRRMSRSEVAKLCLYAAGRGTITLDDIRAASGDVAAFDVDELIDQMTAGDASALDRSYRRLLQEGTADFAVAGAAQRHFNFLEVARASYDAGTPASALIQRARPPVFFKRQAAVAQAIERWPLARIARALAILDQAVVDSRLRGAMSGAVIGQALLMVAALAPARRT